MNTRRFLGETVTPASDKDGVWRVLGYYIKSVAGKREGHNEIE
jgi:hypothetical protein